MLAAVVHFFQTLGEQHPTEETALVSFSSTATLLVPFTKDFTKLASAMYHIISPWINSLNWQKRVAIKRQNLHIPSTSSVCRPYPGAFRKWSRMPGRVGDWWKTQSRWTSDTVRLNYKKDDIQMIVSLPPEIRVHVIAFGFVSDVESESLRFKLKKFLGSFQFVELPHNAHLLKNSFDTLLCSHCI